MRLVEEIRKAKRENPEATKLIVPLDRAEEFTDAVLRQGTSATLKRDIYPFQVSTFEGLEFIGVSEHVLGVTVY